MGIALKIEKLCLQGITMGITVLSSVSSSAALTPLSASPAGDPAAADFAALLGEQISSSLGGLLASLDGKDKAAPEDTPLIQDSASMEAALDPAQLAELGAINPGIAGQLPLDSTKPLAAETAESLLNDLAGSKGLLAGIASEASESPLQSLRTPPNSTQNLLSAPAQQSTADLSERFSEALNNARSLKSGSSSLASQSTSGKADIPLQTFHETANIAAETSPIPTGPANPVSTLTASNMPLSPASSQAPVATNIPTPIQDTRWAQSFGEKIVWLAKNEQQSAQISINPPQLGPMQISLNLSGDQASAIFASPHAEVRQAIEDAMPRLREMLASAGISLGEANVGTQLPQQNRENAPQFSNRARLTDENAILAGSNREGSNTGTLPIQRGRGLVDLFA